MNERLPAPCEHCKATGLFEGSECQQCGGKGYRLIIDGNVALIRADTSTTQPSRHSRSPSHTRRFKT